MRKPGCTEGPSVSDTTTSAKGLDPMPFANKTNSQLDGQQMHAAFSHQSRSAWSKGGCRQELHFLASFPAEQRPQSPSAGIPIHVRRAQHQTKTTTPLPETVHQPDELSVAPKFHDATLPSFLTPCILSSVTLYSCWGLGFGLGL